MSKLFQQGDVLLHQSQIPSGKLERIANPIIQEGEHTGHAHRIVMFRHGEMAASTPMVYEPNWEMLRDKDGIRYLRVKDKPIEISHEEHKTISVPPGEYRIGIVREYSHFDEEARNVVD